MIVLFLFFEGIQFKFNISNQLLFMRQLSTSEQSSFRIVNPGFQSSQQGNRNHKIIKYIIIGIQIALIIFLFFQIGFTLFFKKTQTTLIYSYNNKCDRQVYIDNFTETYKILNKSVSQQRIHDIAYYQMKVLEGKNLPFFQKSSAQIPACGSFTGAIEEVQIQAYKNYMQKRKQQYKYKEGVTAVFTSCGRYDLLQRSLNSFFETNDYPLYEIIVVEDGIRNQSIEPLLQKYKSITWLFTEDKLGQLLSIDKAYEKVQTKYIFHSEDDWLFTAPGYIKASIDYLQKNENVINIWIAHVEKARWDQNTLLLNQSSVTTAGFTFNPTIKRLSDYKILDGGYSGLTRNASYGHVSNRCEGYIASYYNYILGFKTAVHPENFTMHIGSGRHVY